MDEPIRGLFSRLIFLALPFIAVSCIDESGEPTCVDEDQYVVTISVKDKNYDNILEVPELTPKSTSLPFSAYVGGISYRLEELGTKKIVAYKDYFVVDPAEMTHKLVFNDIPNGRYILTTLGNLPLASRNTRATGMFVTLHDGSIENTDIYRGTDTLDFSNTPHTTIHFMSRLKGELLVICKDFPSETDKIVLEVDSIYTGISELARNYAGATTVTQTFGADERLLQLLLAPTVKNTRSTLKLMLYSEGSSTPFIIIPDTKFTIERNEVTEILVDFNTENNTIEISVRIAGAWEKINEMHIDFE